MVFQSTTTRTATALLFAISSFLNIASISDAEASHRHHQGNHSRAKIGGYGFGYGVPYRSHYLPAVVVGGGYPHHHRQAYRSHHAAPQSSATTNTSSKIFAYPANGQNKKQQAQDKFECYNWAVSESGFDPVAVATSGGASATPVSHTVRPNNPGPSDPITGAAGGAALGALGGAIAGDPGLGAAIGAAVGGSVGLANHVDEKSRETTITRHSSSQQSGPSGDYRRAMTACLEARGYTVK
jgi:hypothetical protein